MQASLHAGQRRSREESALSHPTGRLIGHRPENVVDLERTIEVAIETETALEVNGLPNRLDLRDEHVRLQSRPGLRS